MISVYLLLDLRNPYPELAFGDFENPYNAYITVSCRNYAQIDIYKRTLFADMIRRCPTFLILF